VSRWRVLALSPHTDDVELGAGGFVANLYRAGAQVRYVAFSRARSLSGEDSLAECRESVERLGGNIGVEFWGYTPSRLPDSRQEILERLIGIRDADLPDLVLCPTLYDCHQDHQCVVAEAVRAFKRTRVLGYDLHWNTVGESKVDFYVVLGEHDVEAKETALACYAGQQHRPFFAPGTMRAIARFRGEQVGATYAEAFQVIRWIW
jgi:N-acetylglucosamine malate deacetylase 1